MAKRLFDLLAATFALVLLSPAMVLMAIAIKLDSRGPVLFRQERVGRGGIPFRIHKFRTMRADAGTAGLQITVGDDPRITRAGRVLRRLKLDELPQLIDVIAGTMSIVGPRPEVPRYVAMYPAALRDKVLSVRPGITDPASIDHLDENEWLARAPDPERAYVEQVMPAKLRQAACYVETMSLRTDLRLIGATLRRVWWR